MGEEDLQAAAGPAKEENPGADPFGHRLDGSGRSDLRGAGSGWVIRLNTPRQRLGNCSGR